MESSSEKRNASNQEKPNILFIICDDLNNAIAGMGREPCAPAPNLQRLMNEGIRFTNAHNNCPICLPSRNSTLSGLYAHTTGHYTLWEEADQIPLIIKAPGAAHAGSICTQPVSLIDLYPTLIDLCNLPSEPHASTHGHPLEGHSLSPFLEDPQARDWSGPPVALTSLRGDTGIHNSVRSHRYRYTLCQNGEEELYDHRSDPYEWHNISSNPSYRDVKADLRNQMMELINPSDGSA
jgi:arylsulfatase A-like enzyme